MDDSIKQIIEKRGYSIDRELGRGGFGITYLTKNPDNPAGLVVIKTIRDEFLQHLQSNPDALKKLTDSIKSFKKEAEVLVQIQHPNIVKFYTSFSHNHNLELQLSSSLELLFLVVEYIEGENLKQLVDRRGSSLPEAEALGYIQKIGEALAVIHERSLLHRDIKPQNIMVRKATNEAVLIDFGIARDFVPEITQSQTVSYTDPYAPPEQLRRRDKRGCYTDIYGLSATLYYLLTKKLPPSATMRGGIFNEPLVEPKSINPNISNIVNRAILWGMELDSNKRPQTVQEWLVKFSPYEHDLSSECNVDYTRLRDLLAAQKWKEANEKTFAIMLEVSGRQKEGWLKYKSIENFPCTDLRTIDQLWVKYSDERFGFSVQKRIWESVGQDLNKFSDRVGWKKGGWLGRWIKFSELTFDASAPMGNLPYYTRADHFTYPEVQILIPHVLVSRLEKCNL